MATLHVSGNSFEEKTPKEQYEADIINYIHQETDKHFYHVLEADDRWEVFYHLSDLRRTLYNWYDFKTQARLLEIGGGFGALTGLFCENCARVDTVERRLYRAEAISERYVSYENLHIYVEDFEQFELDEKYDYIVLTGILETQFAGEKEQTSYVQFLGKAMSLLKPEGKLLVTFDNRYGLKYFCGAKNPYTGKPFSGLNHYRDGGVGYSFSEVEIRQMLAAAGAEKQKFYYPLPDYRVPRLIYSEEFLPSSNVHERLIPYYENHDPLIASEVDLYKDIVENGVFSFFANSYLVECGHNADFCPVIYGAVTTDRGEEHGFATLVCNDNTVRKKALYAEGKKSLKEFYENIKDIESHGVDVVPHSMRTDGVVSMPYISSVPLSEELATILHRSKEEFLHVFDALYEACLSSSEQVAAEKNQLAKDVIERKEADAKLTEEDYGVILKHSYIDMVPFNCFYVDGKFLFFDQEFRKDCYPAKYTLFRALLYSYYFIPEANNLVPLAMMKEKYGLTGVWDIFHRKEQEFVAENRNHQLYQNFYRWANVDKELLERRAEILNHAIPVEESASSLAKEVAVCRESAKTETEEQKEIVSDSYVQPKSIHRMQEIQKDILRKLLMVCKEQKLRVYPIYGTLLGTVRNGDMIPWDDDIDVMMPREDYDKLVRIAQEKFSVPYYLETPEMAKEAFYGGYAKLFRCDTTAINLKNWGHECCQGICIDIFPLDNFDENIKRRKRQLQKLRVYQRLLFAKTYGKETGKKGFRDVSEKQWSYYFTVSKILSRKFLLHGLQKSMRAANGRETSTVGILARYVKPNAYVGIEKHWFNEIREMAFDDLILQVPEEAEGLLQPIYGENYMKLPDIARRLPKHKAFYDFDTPYKVYFKRFYDIFKGADRQKIILFGCGAMSDDYMKRFGKKYPPAYYIVNDNSFWGKMKDGIFIKNPQEVLHEKPGSYRVVICNIFYHEIGKQLEQMGITDYYIYVQNAAWMVKCLD